VLLIDEFSLGLAPVIVRRFLPLLRDYASVAGAAILLVEQHVQMALGIADRGIVLSRGKVVLAESSARLLSDRSLIAESYIGKTRDQAGASDPSA